MRWAAVDYGRKRIGLALCDVGERIASPAGTLAGRGCPAADADQIIEWAGANEVHGIVVGLPINMDGSIGPQAKLSQALADELRRRGPLPVELWDERLSSYQADVLMSETGWSRRRRARRRDALAAQVILQAFLDARRTRPPDDPEPPPGAEQSPGADQPPPETDR